MEIVFGVCPAPVDILWDGACVGGPLLLGLAALIGLLIVYRIGRSWVGRGGAFADEAERTLRCLVALASADGRLDPMEVAVVRHIAERHFELSVTPERIAEIHRSAGQVDIEAEILGRYGQGRLKEPEAIEGLVAGLVGVAACDGELAAAERRMITRIAVDLGLGAGQVDALLARAEAEAAEWGRAYRHG